MIQQINLYLPEFRLKKDPVTPLLMGQILGGVLAIMVLVSAYDLFTQWRLDSQVAQLEESLRNESQRTSQLDDQLARRSQNSELTDQLDRAEARLEASIQIRDFLSETKLGNVVGFSEFFKDLSRASFDGISLSEFSFAQGGEEVQISGYALDSAMVPRYVDNIEGGNSSLRAHRFNPLISRDSSTDQFFQFSLVTNSE